MKKIYKLSIGLFYLPFLAIALLIALILTMLDLTIVFTYNQSIEWKNEMIIKIDNWVKSIK